MHVEIICFHVHAHDANTTITWMGKNFMRNQITNSWHKKCKNIKEQKKIRSVRQYTNKTKLSNKAGATKTYNNVQKSRINYKKGIREIFIMKKKMVTTLSNVFSFSDLGKITDQQLVQN